MFLHMSKWVHSVTLNKTMVRSVKTTFLWLESHFPHSFPQTAQCSSCLFAENFIILDNYVYWRRKHQIPLCQHQELPGLILHIHIYIKCTSGSWASYIIYIYYTQKPLIVRFLKNTTYCGENWELYRFCRLWKKE